MGGQQADIATNRESRSDYRWVASFAPNVKISVAVGKSDWARFSLYRSI
jgi:hypothetical protein